MLDNLFEKLYDAEWARKDAIQGDTTLPLGVLALFGSGLVVLLKEYDSGYGLLDLLFWLGFAVASMAYVTAIYTLVRSFYGHNYWHMSFPSSLKKCWDGLRAHYSAQGAPLVADREFEEYLQALLIRITDRNAAINVRRAEYLRKTNRAIIVVLIASGVSSIPYAIRERMQNHGAAAVETVHRESAMSERSNAATPARPPVPPKPAPPNPFEEHTGVEPPGGWNESHNGKGLAAALRELLMWRA